MRVKLILAVVVALILSYWLGYAAGRAQGATSVATAAVQSAASAAGAIDTQRVRDAQVQVQRADISARRHESTRARVDTYFRQLDQGATHATPHAVDACTLPPERLQRWADANAGPGVEAPAARQPDDAASAPADAHVGSDAGSGDEPPRRRPAVPPAGQPDVRPAGVPAGADGGV